jgi:hypothetical protein
MMTFLSTASGATPESMVNYLGDAEVITLMER